MLKGFGKAGATGAGRERLMRLGTYAFLGLVIAGVAAYGTYNALGVYMSVPAPDLADMPAGEAEDIMTSAGLRLVISERRTDPSVPAGSVIAQMTPPGERMPLRGRIEVVVSTGPTVMTVPTLTSLTAATARKLVENEGGMIAREIEVRSDTTRAGTVLAQSPAPGTRTADPITIIVSAGPRALLYYCPQMVGLTYEKAQALAGSLGLGLDARGIPLAFQVVKAQRPPAGSLIKAGQRVGVELGTTPDVRGES